MLMSMSKKAHTETFESLYKELNPKQKEAVDTIEGPVLVIAGPGTGKTQVLTMRIANILKKTDTPSSAILALTFTDSGVKAMRERLLSIIGSEAYYVNIYTFHSFCSDILRSNPDRFVLSEDLEPLSDLERVQIFREILDEGGYKNIRPFGGRYYYVRSLIRTIQDLKREGISEKDFEKFIEKSENFEKLSEVLDVYSRYLQKLKEKNRYDFEDMINLVTERFDNDANLLRDYQERYLYFLVDEYQDTNSPQNKVAHLLASYWGDEANVFVVGDDSQSIYRFQGASLDNILFFTKNYPKAKIITLKENYRSQKVIIGASEDLIKNNELKLTDFLNVEKRQESAVTYEDKRIELGHFSSGITESFFVSTQIKKLVEDGVLPSEIAVIYRNNADSKDFSDMFGRMGIPFNLIGGENVLEDYDINKLLKLLDVILKVRSKEEDLDLFTIFNYEFLDFDYVDTLKLSRFASEKKINFVEAINHPDFKKSSGVLNALNFEKFLDKLYEWQSLDSNLTFTAFFERVLEESGFLNWVISSRDSIEKLNRLNSLFAEIKKLNTADHSLNLKKFMEDVLILKESGIPINEEALNIRNNSVLLTTAHRSKGLEFEYVFLVKCFDGKWGNNKVRDLIKLPEGLVGASLGVKDKAGTLDASKEKNEDERRLFYVAMTRAKKGLFVTYADSYFTEGSLREAVPSMFISEISKDKTEEIEVSKYESSVKEILKDILKPVTSENVSIEEKDFLKSVLKNFSLSVTALNTYLECPYKFKLNNLLRTPRAKDKYLALGTAVHKALEIFFREFKNTGKLPDLPYLLSEFEKAISEEILTERDFLETRAKGSLILKAYFGSYNKEFQKPLFTEKFFGYGNSKVYLDNIPLNGKVDKIDYVDVSRKYVKVIDYKTGKAKSRNDVEGKTKYSNGGYKRQLVFYKLLADLDRTFNFTVTDAELDFVEPDKNGKFSRHSFNISLGELEELKLTIKDVMKKIRELKFERTTNYKTCVNCDYRAHCWPNGIPKGGGEDSQLELEV